MRSLNTLFIKQLSTIDSTVLCTYRGLVGETWLVDVELTGTLNEEGMLFDFSEVKSNIKSFIDCHLDHKLLVPVENNLDIRVNHYKKQVNISAKIINSKRNYTIIYSAPEQAVSMLPIYEIKPKLVAIFLEKELLGFLPSNIYKINVNLYPEPIKGTTFNYSHGLKKHLGNCQRIAHGHRSAMDIYLNGERAIEEEIHWSRLWKNTVFVTNEDIKSHFVKNNQSFVTTAYTASQGFFELTLPDYCIYTIDCDSTIERLAEHLVSCVVQRHKNCSVKVSISEGFNKGATGCNYQALF